MTRAQQRYVDYRGGLGVTSQTITSTVGGALMSAAPFTGPAAPFVAAAGALTSLVGSLFKPDLTKVEATRIVDQIEAQYLRPNLARWNALPAAQRTRSAQAAALDLVDKALNAVREGCSNPALAEAGQRCISERLIQGGTAPWCPTGTGCDWITLYRDPIANDPNVIPDPAGAGSSGPGTFFGAAGPGGIPMPLLIGAALLGVGLLWE